MKTETHQIRRQRGLTLVESLIGLAITALTVGLSVPSFGSARERRHLEGAAAQLETDIQLARSEAVQAGHTVRLRFARNGENCYVIYTGRTDGCSCTSDGATRCTGNAQALHAAALDRSGVQMQSNVNAMTFEPIQGTVTPTGTVSLLGQRAHTVRVVVNLMGRVRTCTPTRGFEGFKAC